MHAPANAAGSKHRRLGSIGVSPVFFVFGRHLSRSGEDR
jgi:hypothetical protein